MLQTIRKMTQGWVSVVIASVIAAVMALWGAQRNYNGGKDKVLAKVNGVKITAEQVETAYEQHKAQIVSIFGKKAVLNQNIKAEIKRRALQSLIDEQILLYAARKLGMQVSHQQLLMAVAALPVFQTEGVFSPELYQRVVRSIFHSEAAFFEHMRSLLLHQQLELGLISSGFLLPNERSLVEASINQKRDFGFFSISPQTVVTAEPITDQAIETYYQTHTEDFMTPEMVSIQYVELTTEDVTVDQFAKATETLSELLYANPTTLTPAAEALGLTIKTAGPFSRSGETAQLHAQLIQAAFSPTTLQDGYNSELVKLTPEKVAAVRIQEHFPEKLKPLEQVRSIILDRLTQVRNSEAAQNLATELMQALTAGTSEEILAKKHKLVWQHSVDNQLKYQGTNSQTTEAVFRLPQPDAKQAPVVTVIKEGENYLVVRLEKVYAAVSSDQKDSSDATSRSQALSTAYGRYEYRQLIHSFRNSAKIKLPKEKLYD